MNKQIALLMLATITLAACASSNKHNAQHAPIVDLVLKSSSNADSVSEEAPKAEVPQSKVALNEPAALVSDGGYLPGDGPGKDAPRNLDDIPNAVPKAEPLHRYANRPYTALGKTYKPLRITGNYKETGIASWYGKKFHGQRTSIGEVYDMYAMTAAHPTLPIPSYARVTNLANHKSVIVRVNDRGPFLHNRIIDLSYTAAYKLGILNSGSAKVEVESIDVGKTASTSAIVSAPIQTKSLVSDSIAPVVSVPAKLHTKGKYYLQLGAFKSAEGAKSFLEKMRSTLGGEDKALSLSKKNGLSKIYLGTYVSEREARTASEKLSAQLGFKPFLSAP